MRKYLNRMLTVLFLGFLLVMFSMTLVKYGRNYAYGFFKGYKEYVQEDAGIIDNIRARIGRLEYNAGERLFLRSNFRAVNANFQNLIGKDMINIGKYYTVRLKSGGYYDLFTGAYGDEKAQELIEFAGHLKEEKGIPTMFVYCHCGLYEEDVLPEIYRDFDNNNEGADFLLKKLKDAGVPTVDSREVYKKANLTIDQAILRGDIHWTHRMAFETAAEAVRVMNAEYGWKLDEQALLYERFDSVVYEDLLYGEIAQRLGDGLAEYDDIHVMSPKYDSHIEYRSVGSDELIREGSFEDTIILKEKLEPDESGLYMDEKNTTAYYLYGEYMTKLHTTNKDAQPIRVLVFKDSYGTPVSSFLSLAAGDVYAIDLRSTEHSMNEWVEIVQPDVVLFAYSQQMLRNFNYVIAN